MVCPDVFVPPTFSQEVFERFQVDLIDKQSSSGGIFEIWSSTWNLGSVNGVLGLLAEDFGERNIKSNMLIAKNVFSIISI